VITVSLPLPPRNLLEQRYAEHQDSYDKLLHELQRRTRSALSGCNIRATIKYRVKSFNSYYEKLLRIVRDTGQQSGTILMTDVVAMRIVCPFLGDVAAALRTLREQFDIHELDRKGAEFTVREFGYESVHCLLTVPQDLCESFHLGGNVECEVQVRTILQDAWAEVEHELVYKSDFAPFDEAVRRKLAALNANLSLSDITFQEIRDRQRKLSVELRKRRRDFWDTLRETVGGIDGVNGAIPTPDSLQAEPADLGVPPALGMEASETPRGEVPSADALSDQVWSSSHGLDAELLSALEAHNAGDYERAKGIYTAILASGPRIFVRAIVLMHRGMAQFADGSYRAALDDFSAAIDLDEKNSRAHFYRGTVYRVLGDTSLAEADFARCLHIDPYRIDCLYQRSAMRLQHGDLAGAREDCEAALAVEPQSEMLQRLMSSISERSAYGDAHG
jgi:putative GTP pyrophosphokinase